MTTARRVLSCPSCGFALDHMLHFRNCVPTSQWPRELRERKAAAMHGSELDVMEIDGKRLYVNAPIEPREYEPEPEKPRGIAEYRRLHPEANPLTTENLTVREFRTRDDGGQDEWDRVVGVREAMSKAQPCPRCQRPMLDRSMHITCRPVDGSAPPERTGSRLQRDDVPLTPRHPVIHTQDEVRTGAGWFNALPEATDPAPDEDELRDFVAFRLIVEVNEEKAAEVEEPRATELRDRLAAEQAAWKPTITERAGDGVIEGAIVVDSDACEIQPLSEREFVTLAAEAAARTCPTCGRVSKSAAGNSAHQRSHKADA